MKVLIACEFSGVVRDAFKDIGHDAVSCDLLPTEKPGQHYQGDVFDIIGDGWDMMIAHPPCTYLCNSGVRWLHTQDGRWDKMREGAKFFKRLLECEIETIAVENPIPHKYAVEIIGRKYDQIVQPWQHGHGETKATCLWLKGLNKLVPSNIVDGRKHKIHMMSPSKYRSMGRSLTYQGIAKAMSLQWNL